MRALNAELERERVSKLGMILLSCPLHFIRNCSEVVFPRGSSYEEVSGTAESGP